MNDEEIEKALKEADDIAINEDVDCCDVLDYINRLKDEIAGLTGKADALESDRDNLLRTLGEANEKLVFLEAEIKRVRHNWEISKAVQRTKVSKKTARTVAQEFCFKIEQCGLDYGAVMKTLETLAEKYGVEVK